MFFEDCPVFILFKNKIITCLFLFCILTRERSVVFSGNHRCYSAIITVNAYTKSVHWKMTIFSNFTWKVHFSSTNMSYPVKSTPVTNILGWLCSDLSKNWSGVSLSKNGRYKIAAQWAISERKSKSFTFLIHMEIFHENVLVLLTRHGIKKPESTYFYTF